jgi:PHD/YefM family antitoxin component YafN of YafNO toxin-antitoxin module
MDPEYDLARLGYPNELRRFTEMVEGVERTRDPVIVTRFDRPVAVLVHPDDLALLRRLAIAALSEQSDDSGSGQ